MLAGGIGSRFWPMSTPDRPKQLLPLASERALIVDTLDRARTLAPLERVRILTGNHLAAPFREAISDLGDRQFLIEPAARGTGPVLAWAAFEALREDPEAVLVSLHADHRIEPIESFADLLLAAAALASRERLLLTIGVPPTRPETGYGYLQPGDTVAEHQGHAARRVEAFHEKPGVETARDYIEAGYLWNSGIFVWRADVLLEEVRAHAPEISGALQRLEAGDVEGYFDAVEPVPVDVAVLERSSRVATLPCTFEWDDVGSWASLTRTREADPAGNVTLGDATVVEGRRNVVVGDAGPVVVWGADDLVVVRTRGVTFVTPRERAPDLKSLLSRLPEALRTPEV